MKSEGSYQRDLKKRIEETFPGCLVLKNDPTYIQGIPDLTVVYGKKYALLEVKKSKNEPKQPNQQTYVDKVNDMGSYASFIFPENEEVIIDELKNFFEPQQ